MVEKNAAMLGRIGISSWTYPWAMGTVPDYCPHKPMSVSALVRKAAELQVQVVQVADNQPLDNLTSAELRILRELAREHAVELQVGTRGVDHSHLLKYLRIAQQLGAKLVRTLGGLPGHPAPISEIQDNINSILPTFIEAGVSIALENYEVYQTRDLAHLVSRIGHANFGICLDVTNSFATPEGAEQILENLAPFAINVHLKDFTIERTNHLMGFTCIGRPIGNGQLPLGLILQRLTAFNRRPDLIVELWPPFQNTLKDTLALESAWATESVNYLRNFLDDFNKNRSKPTAVS